MRLRGAAILSLLILAVSVWLIVGASKSALPVESDDGPSMMARAPMSTAQSEESWLILPSMPADATQADIGAEIYALVCRDCHGDVGQGLTDEWRATWDPQDQNCWQSKCHAGNHPVEGFDLPRYVPAIIGPDTATSNWSEETLHAFLQARMPWHNPGSLTSDEYWQLTAFLMRENGRLASDDALN